MSNVAESFDSFGSTDGQVTMMIQNWGDDIPGLVRAATFTTTPKVARAQAIKILEAAQRAEDLAMGRS